MISAISLMMGKTVELHVIELETHRILEQATRELAEVESERNIIRQAWVLHKNALNNYKNA